MKKLLFPVLIVSFLAAGCGSSQPTVQNNPVPVKVANHNPASSTPPQEANANINQTNNSMDNTNSTKQADLMAILSANAYGYNITVSVNGQELTLKGNSSGGARLFNKENSYYGSASPQVLKENGMLVQGNNTFAIKYTKIDPSSDKKLHIDLQMQGYSSPLLTLDAADASGSVEQTVDIEPTQPANFKSITIER